MFTNNYIALKNAQFFGSQNTIVSNGILWKDVTAVNGESRRIYSSTQSTEDIGMYMFNGQCMSVYSGQTGVSRFLECGVYFGSGSTPATKADYCLENPIVSGLTITNPSTRRVTDNGNGSYTAEAPFMLTNTTETEINIWELGCFIPVLTAANSYASFLLVERTVLPDPITIAPGETKLVNYKLTFNQTLNVE